MESMHLQHFDPMQASNMSCSSSGMGPSSSKRDPTDTERETVGKRRPRKRYIRKVTCLVCGDVANDHIHYGAIACYSCRAFFRRSVSNENRYDCSRSDACPVTKETRKHCQACRFRKCKEIGMKPSWVMSEDERKDKRAKVIREKRDMRKGVKRPTATPLGITPEEAERQVKVEVKEEAGEESEDHGGDGEEEREFVEETLGGKQRRDSRGRNGFRETCDESGGRRSSYFSDDGKGLPGMKIHSHVMQDVDWGALVACGDIFNAQNWFRRR